MTESQDGVLRWAKSQLTQWDRQIDMLQRGVMKTSANGVDDSQKTLDDLIVRRADLEALIDRHEGRVQALSQQAD